MLNNPFAKLFYDKFHEEVLNQSTFYGSNETIDKTPLESKFIERFNLFLKRCGQQPVDTSHHIFPTRNWHNFVPAFAFI